MNTIIYLKNLMSDKYIASVTPTSRFGVERICGKINFQESKLIVEYGPGMGIFTYQLLEYMAPHSKLIAIERNPNFYRILKKHIRDPRVAIFNDSAENVLDILRSCNGSGEPRADCIISGIPFSLIPMETKMAILKNTHSALKKGGNFVAYQAFFQTPKHLKIPLAKIFQNVRTRYVVPCIPPLVLFEAFKKV